MKSRLMIALAMSIVLLSSPAFAQELFQYETTVEIFQNMSASYEEGFIFSDSDFDMFTTIIEGEPENIFIRSPIDCDAARKSWGTEISCDVSSLKGERFNIFIEYSVTGRVEEIDGRFVFRDSIKSPTQASTMLLLVKVPEGMGLIKKSGESLYEQPYLPSMGFVSTDGRRPIVTWEKANVSSGDGIDSSVVYEQISIGIVDSSTSVLLGALIIIVLGVSAFYFFYWRKRTSVKVVMPILKHDEKSVMESLIKHGGKGVNQKIIVGESGYSKAKVSKVLKSLQERGVLRLERIGRKNKVHIVREFKKEEQKTSGNNPK